jgi:hypothetical protein
MGDVDRIVPASRTDVETLRRRDARLFGVQG